MMTFSNKIERIIDVGCGVGVYCALLQRHFPFLKYIGYDYAPAAIKIALAQWGCNNFFTKDCKDLIQEDFDEKDVIVTNGFFDIIPDANKMLSIILQLDVNFIIIQRVRITSEQCFFEKYSAYATIETGIFHHNITELYDTIKNNHYKILKVHIDEDKDKTMLDLLLEKEK